MQQKILLSHHHHNNFTASHQQQHDQNSANQDFQDAIDILNDIIQVDQSLNVNWNIGFTLTISLLGTCFNILAFIVCVLMLRSLLHTEKSHENVNAKDIDGQSQIDNEFSKTITHKIINKKHLRGKSRLMEYYLMEIFCFDLIKTSYVSIDQFYLLFFRKGAPDKSLEDLSNFCCKAFSYMQKVCSLMSCWLIVCFALNRLCLLISSRYSYFPLVGFDEDSSSTGPTIKVQKKRRTNNNLHREGSRISTQSSYSVKGPYGNIKLVINSKKSTVILFLIFALINIYLIEITGLVDDDQRSHHSDLSNDDVLKHLLSQSQNTNHNETLLQLFQNEMSTNPPSENSSAPFFTMPNKHCMSANLENKSVIVLHITIYHIFGFLIPNLITIFALYHLIKNLCKIKTKINQTIKRKSQPLFIRSNELIFFRTSMTAIVLSIFYLVTKSPYDLISILAIIKHEKPRTILLLSYAEYLNIFYHSFKFLLIYFASRRFRHKAHFLFSKLFCCGLFCMIRSKFAKRPPIQQYAQKEINNPTNQQNNLVDAEQDQIALVSDFNRQSVKQRRLRRDKQMTLTIVDSAALLSSIRQHSLSSQDVSCNSAKTSVTTTDSTQHITSVSENSKRLAWLNNTINIVHQDKESVLAQLPHRENSRKSKNKFKPLDFGEYYDDLCFYYHNYMNKKLNDGSNSTQTPTPNSTKQGTVFNFPSDKLTNEKQNTQQQQLPKVTFYTSSCNASLISSQTKSSDVSGEIQNEESQDECEL